MAKTNRSKDQRQNDATARKPMAIISLQFPKSSIISLVIDPVHFENVQPFYPFLIGCILPISYRVHPAHFLSGASFEAQVKASGPKYGQGQTPAPIRLSQNVHVCVCSQPILIVSHF